MRAGEANAREPSLGQARRAARRHTRAARVSTTRSACCWALHSASLQRLLAGRVRSPTRLCAGERMQIDFSLALWAFSRRSRDLTDLELDWRNSRHQSRAQQHHHDSHHYQTAPSLYSPLRQRRPASPAALMSHAQATSAWPTRWLRNANAISCQSDLSERSLREV